MVKERENDQREGAKHALDRESEDPGSPPVASFAISNDEIFDENNKCDIADTDEAKDGREAERGHLAEKRERKDDSISDESGPEDLVIEHARNRGVGS